MEKPRHFPLRHDIFTHARTSWMLPEDLAVFACISSASILGVSTYSPNKIARMTKVNVDKITHVLHNLADPKRGVIRWWPDEEIAWAVERADEAGVCGKQWLAAQREWREYPDHVQAVIADRYPVLRTTMSGQPDGHLASGGKGHADAACPSGISKATVTVTVTDPVTVRSEYVDLECAKVHEGLAWIKPAGKAPLLYYDDRVRKIVRAGATADEILDTLRRHAERVEAGEEPADHWAATYFFSGYFERLRGLEAAPKRESL